MVSRAFPMDNAEQPKKRITVHVWVPASLSAGVARAINQLANFGYNIIYCSIDGRWTITGDKEAIQLLSDWIKRNL